MAFVGKFEMVSSEKFEDYLSAVGVGFATRKIAAAAKPTVVIEQNGDEIVLKTLTTFKNTELKFKLGQEFVEDTADGRKCNTTFTQEGNKLIQTQKLGDITTSIVREFNGDQLITTFQAKDVTSTRTYKRV